MEGRDLWDDLVQTTEITGGTASVDVTSRNMAARMAASQSDWSARARAAWRVWIG